MRGTRESASGALRRQHDGEDDQDGDGADVDEDLGEADELCVEAEVERGESGEGDGESEDAVDELAQGHGGDGTINVSAARIVMRTVIGLRIVIQVASR